MIIISSIPAIIISSIPAIIIFSIPAIIVPTGILSSLGWFRKFLWERKSPSYLYPKTPTSSRPY